MRQNGYKAVIPIVSGIAYVANPLLRPQTSFAVDVDEDTFVDEHGEEHGEATVILYDRSKEGDEALVGGVVVQQGVVAEDSDRWVVQFAAARAGYGPLVYDLTSRVVQRRIYPSTEQSSHAERFWRNQPAGYVAPLSDREFMAKYGAAPPVPLPLPRGSRFRAIFGYAAGEGMPLERALRAYDLWIKSGMVSNPGNRMNPIPELVKGSRTPYRRYTREWEFLAPQSRDRAFEQTVYAQTGVYPTNVYVFRALGSGKHWVGVLVFEREEHEDYTLYSIAITLQSGKSWSVAENKVLRWFRQPNETEGHYSETGAGSVEFMRWVLDKVKDFVKVRRIAMKRPTDKPARIKAGWGNPQRERAYAWLTRYGFRKVADAGDGDPAYILDIQYEPKSNPADLAGRHIPEKYLAGLPPALQKQRIRELTESRDAYRSGDFSELATDRTARKMGLVKESSYTTVAKKRGIEWRGSPEDMAARVLQYYGAKPTQRDVAEFAEALKKVFAKGLAAWKSGGHRPGATAQNWAVARVNSVAVGGKAAWTADRKQFAVLPESVRKKIVAKLPEVYKALKSQGRQKDVESIQGKAVANPIVDPELRKLVGEHTGVKLYKPLEAYARKMLAKYGSRAAGDDVIRQIVAEAQEAILAYFYEKTDDNLIRYYRAESPTLMGARSTALNIGKLAINGAVSKLMSITGEADLEFWKKLSAYRRFITRPGAPLASDSDVAKYLGITLDDLNRKKFEHRILSSTSYDRLLGLGVESARSAERRELSDIFTTEQPSGPPPREIAAPEVEGFEDEGALDPFEITMRRELGIREGLSELEDEVVSQVLQNLSTSDRILLQSYIGGEVAPGMRTGEFERAIEGGWSNRSQQYLPGLKDRLHAQITTALTAVAALPAEKKAAIAEGDLTVQEVLALTSTPAQIAGPTAARTPAARLKLRSDLG